MGAKCLICILLTAWLIIETKLVLSDDFAKNVEPETQSGWLPNNPKIIYDVTDIISKYGHIELKNIFEEKPIEYRHPALFYNELKGNISTTSCSWNITDSLDDTIACNKTSTKAVSIMLNDDASAEDVNPLSPAPLTVNKIAHLLQMDAPFIDSVIISIESSNQICDSVKFQLKTIVDLKTSKKVGLEYPLSSKCCVKSSRESLNNVVLKVEATPFTTKMSYSVFFNMMSKNVAQFRQCVSEMGFNGTVYIRLAIKNLNNAISEEYYIRFEALMLRFFHAWAKEHTGNEKFIIRPPIRRVLILDNLQFFKKSVVALSAKYDKSSDVYKQSKDTLSSWNCESRSPRSTLMYSLYNEILFTNPAISSFDIKSSECSAPKEEELIESSDEKRHYSLQFQYTEGIDVSKDFDELRDVINSNVYNNDTNKTVKLNRVVPNLQTVYFGSSYVSLWEKKHTERANHTKFPNNPSITEQANFTSFSQSRNTTELSKLANFLKSRNITVGCTFKFDGSLWQTAREECSSIFDISTEYIVTTNIDLKHSEEVFDLLLNLQTQKQQFEKRHIGKYITPLFKQTSKQQTSKKQAPDKRINAWQRWLLDPECPDGYFLIARASQKYITNC